MVSDPVTVGPDATIAQLDELCGHYKVSGLPVVDSDGNCWALSPTATCVSYPPRSGTR